MNKQKPLMVLATGSYRSGTNGDPQLIQKNVNAMNEVALIFYNKGHLSVLGEWFALPLIETEGSKEMGGNLERIISPGCNSINK